MELNLILEIISTVCTVIATILAILAARKYIFKETYYGKKADDVFKDYNLKDKDLIESYEYTGYKSKRFPQIVIEGRIFKKKITYFVEEENKRMVKVWNLK